MSTIGFRPPRALLWIAVPVTATAYQATAKLMAMSLDRIGTSEQATLALALVGFDLLCFIAWLFVLERTNLAVAFPLSAASYVLVIACGAVLFGEQPTLAQGCGATLILLGLWLMSSQSLIPSSGRGRVKRFIQAGDKGIKPGQ